MTTSAATVTTLPAISPYAIQTASAVHANRTRETVDNRRAALLVHDMQSYVVDAFDGLDPQTQIDIAIRNIGRFVEASHAQQVPHGIRCNVVAPGTTRTSMLDELDSREGGLDCLPAGDTAAFRTVIPLGRIAAPEDVADVIRFLLSRQFRHLTLQEVVVDGAAA